MGERGKKWIQLSPGRENRPEIKLTSSLTGLECSDDLHTLPGWSTIELNKLRGRRHHPTTFTRVLVHFSSRGDSKIPCKGLKNEFWSLS